MRKEVIGEAVLFQGDCREWMESLPSCFRVDALVTDPPYGVNYKGSGTKWTAPDGVGYASFDDTPDAVRGLIVPRFEQALKLAERAALTPGLRCYSLYPKADGEGVIWYPSGANAGPWGFVTHQPIFYYGKCPYLADGGGSRPTGFQSTEPAEKNGHPCPKPVGQMIWLVNRVTRMGETVLDPFMGSGTTGVACVATGRKFIGVEIEPKYFDIACRRMEDAQRQQRMFA